jgi:hypothetical protein
VAFGWCGIDDQQSFDRAGEPVLVLLHRPRTLAGEPIEDRWIHLVPNSNSTVGTDTSAWSAIIRMVEPANPRLRSTALAASRTRRRVSRA